MESGVVFEDGPVTFQDPVTEQMLRNMIGKPEGEVLRSELQEIHAIYWVLGSYWSNLQYEDKNAGDQGEFAGRQPQSLEDFALCEFVDPSKIDIQQIIRDGINLMIREA